MTLDLSIANSILSNTSHEDEFEEKFDYVKIGLASAQRILGWSYGEVTKPETINYRTLKPERDGLFCEKIFGPAKDWECHCGKYKRVRHKGIVCERCGVEVTDSKVRRHRMGHIKLAAPVCHIWYLKGIPSHLSLLLDMPLRHLEDITYYNSYVVIDPGNIESLSKRQLLTEDEYETLVMDEDNKFDADMGAPAIKKLLADLNLPELAEELRKDVKEASNQKRAKLIKRLRVIESLVEASTSPAWMVLDVVPVIPPDLRPMVQLDGGRFATSDLNDLYRRVINRNNRLSRLLDMEAPDIIIRNEKRMLQEAVDALIDNGRRGRAVVGPNNRALKSLSDIIEGKQGRFRQNLLGKRVDYSGRSVIVVGPKLKLHQCGLPREMALELFKPFVMNKLVERGIVQNIKSAKKKIESQDSLVWDVLEDVIKGHPVLLNRAPTLHRLGIQAFEPLLVEGRAIQLHPLVCTAFNADFDGDQMAVHVPLSIEAQTEARLLMLATNNILTPATGTPIITPTKDMVLGCYYLTVENVRAVDLTKRIFANTDEILSIHEIKAIHVHNKIKVRMNIDKLAKTEEVYASAAPDAIPQTLESLLDSGYAKQHVFFVTTVGRVILNEELPPSFKFVNKMVDKHVLEEIISECFLDNGNIKTSELANSLKELGFHYSTMAGISIAIDDMIVPEEKKDILRRSEKEIERSQKLYQKGQITAVERYAKIIDTWSQATNEVIARITEDYDKLNSVFMMAFSGARGNISQVRQLVGMRGLMSDPSGKTIDLPIKSNFKEGLNVTEYVISCYGARKGLVDTALRTADSGYLTRRLADVAQDVIITDEDCGTDNFILFRDIWDGDKLIVGLEKRLAGRTSAEDIFYPKKNANDASEEAMLIVCKNQMINPAQAKDIIRVGVTESTLKEAEFDKKMTIIPGVKIVKLRSPLGCQNKYGVCRACYGWSLTSKRLVDIGEAVGIIAAQSIGEPGTQLTMRTFHTGGVFEGANRIKVKANHSGTVKLDQAEFREMTDDFRTPYGEVIRVTKQEYVLKIADKKGKIFKVEIPNGSEIQVKDGDVVKPATIVAEQMKQSKASQKSVEKGFRDINSDISGMVKFIDFKTEEKKDRQGLISRTSNAQGVIWVHSGNVYSLPSDCEILVNNNQFLNSDESLGRIATTTEYGGKVQVMGHKEDGTWDSISLVTAELDIPEPDVILNRKDLQLKFPDEYPVNIFQLLVHEGSKVESGTVIAEAFVDKYVTPSSGEVRFLNVDNTDKNTLTGESSLLFLPEENYQLGSTGNPLVEDSCMVEAGDEIIPGINVNESGFVSLENLDLSQSITFYPGAYGVYFPLENSIINVTENQEIEEGALLGQLTDPETEENQPIYSKQKGMVQFIHSEEGMYLVVRNTFIYTVAPIDKFYKLSTSHSSIDLVPLTKVMVRNGDKLKAGTALVKVNLVFKLSSPLTLLGGKVEFKNIERDEDGNDVRAKLTISVIENLTTSHDPSNYGLIGHQELKINSILQVKENDVVPSGKVIAYTDFMIQSPGKIEIFKDNETGTQKLLIINAENQTTYKTDDVKFESGQYIYEGDKINSKIIATESGIVEEVKKDEVTIRKARPYLVSQGSAILVDHGEMVQQGETLAILVYESVKTGDIVQGLPRVEELLEARKPKESSILAEEEGSVNLVLVDNEVISINVVNEEGITHNYKVPINGRPIVIDGEKVKRGDRLTTGPVSPHDILAVAGIEAVQQFLVNEVQLVYRSQGVQINDKHIEIIVRQMTRKKRIVDSGETTLLPGEVITTYQFDQVLEKCKTDGIVAPIAENVLLGITKASLNTESFISAASFQETTRVLTEAAIEGKRDWLRGLKENVIIGRLIPAGTGMREVQLASETREEQSMEMTIG
ncbi:MAG: DNA-directed RNA polymerase subunit beta' [Candidatus Sericytochromatia bacterium]|nr:DNA-directed RNA polymerase subunit beta' [Candidatus Sericytochromatia bacterium]